MNGDIRLEGIVPLAEGIRIWSEKNTLNADAECVKRREIMEDTIYDPI